MAEVQLEATVQDIGRALARIALLDVRDLFDEKGALVPPHELPEHVALALEGIDVVEAVGGMKVEVSREKGKKGGGRSPMHVPTYTKKVRFDRMEALKLLAQWKRMLVDQVETRGPSDLASMSDEELEREHKALSEVVNLIRRPRKAPKVKVKKDPQSP
jgi:hypothetical protein